VSAERRRTPASRPQAAHSPQPGATAEEPGAGTARAARAPFEIVYRDEHLLVVDKAAGVVVHPARGHRDDTLAQLLAPLVSGEAGAAEARRGIVHRLDRDTSGLMVVARTDEAHRELQAALAARRIEREYLALVEGRPPARAGTIEAPIGRDPRVRTRMAVGGAGAREARTHFTLERALAGRSLLRLKLETGRTHQIRVHLQAIGHPVTGDPEYGTPGLLGLRRQFLHATRLAFAHPVSGERVEVDSPLPADLREALERATAAGGAGGRIS
jgi:23S rRNA pseudouridine1911/1915/1917 synthase